MGEQREEAYDLAVVGAGPGGYVAALRAAQLGMHVGLVEERELGGVCLNRGCIPTKAMLDVAELTHRARTAAASGLFAGDGPTVDYQAVLAHRDKAVDRLTRGVAGLLKHGGVEVHTGRAAFTGPASLAVTGDGAAQDTNATITADAVIVATGSVPVSLPIPGTDHERVLDSDGALALDGVPERLIVLGGGAVGCEWSTIFSRLGADVTLIELLPTLLPRTEPELGDLLGKVLRAEGIDVRTDTTVESFAGDADGVTASLSGGDELQADYVLVAAGRTANTEGLGLDAAGVSVAEGGWIEIDDACRTNVPSVYAIGDVTGGALLAHVASRQGVVVAETLAGLSPAPVRSDRIPAVTFTDPEVATVGLTEEEARDQGFEVEVGRFPFSASGKAVATGHDTGIVKLVAEARFGRLLGAHIIGPHAGELLAEAVLALDLEATMDELTSVIRSHPTLSEAVGEAAMAAEGHALHSV